MLFKLPFAGIVAGWYVGCAVLVGIAHAERHPRRPTVRSLSRRAEVRGQFAASRRHARVAVAKHRPIRHAWDANLSGVPRRGEFRRLFRVRATAYMPRASEGGRYTFTERDGRAAHGIAVDPRMIPLGSRLWIPGYGHGIADDTGGMIKGHHIDIRVQEHGQLVAWGARQVSVYILADPCGTP